MAFKRFLKNKELTDLKENILLEAFERSGFNVDSTSFATIRSKIQINELDAELILESTESEIINECKLQECEESKEKLLIMRARIRKTDALKHPISDNKLKKKEVENFSKEEIYNLLENKVNSTDDSQSQYWYSHIEKNAMTGISFLRQEKCALEQVFKLTEDQAIKLGILLEKIDPPVQSQAQPIIIKNAAAGVVGPAKVSIGGNMTVSHARETENENNSRSSEDKCTN